MNRQRAVDSAATITVPAGAPDWVTPELLAHTQRVWQPYYPETLSELDVLDILLRTAALFEVVASES